MGLASDTDDYCDMKVCVYMCAHASNLGTAQISRCSEAQKLGKGCHMPALSRESGRTAAKVPTAQVKVAI